MNLISIEAIEEAYTALKGGIETAGPLSPETWDYLRTHSRVSFYKRKALMIREGEHPHTTGFIIQGAAKSYFIAPADGREIVTRLYSTHEICGPDNFQLGELSKENIQFVKDSWVINTSFEDVMTMYNTFPDYARLYATLLEFHNRMQGERLLDLQMMTVSQLLEKTLTVKPHLFAYFSMGDIASYLGTNRETLTRLRSKLQRH